MSSEKEILADPVFELGTVDWEGKQVRQRGIRDAEVTKKSILLAAMHEFSEFGDGGARIDRIAERANANKSLIYAYFGNKEQLYSHVLREAYAQIRAGQRALELDHLEPFEAVRQLIRFTKAHYLESPWFLRLLATENLRRGMTVNRMTDLANLQSPMIRQLATILERGAASGVFKSGMDAVDLYILIASFFYFPISNADTIKAVFGADVHREGWLEARAKLAEDMILDHLRAP